MENNFQRKAKFAAFAFFIAAALLLAGAKLSSAQDKPSSGATSAAVVADVNIRNAKIEKQENNTLTISFDISNNFSQVQPGILLSASLVKNENNARTTVDEKIIGSEFTLEPNEKSHRVINYAVSDFIQGQYEIWLDAQIAGGLPLSTMIAGKTTFSGTNDYVEIINNSCYLTVKGESGDKKYAFNQGVDIEKNEDLQAVCDLMNHSSQPKKFIAQFQTYQRNTFGPLTETSQKTDTSFILNPKEKKTVPFDLPKASDPQAYDVKLTLLENGKTISNSSVFHYVLRGASATIQSLQLDKDSYQKGEKANAILIATGPADNFPNSRHGAGKDLQGANLAVKIQSGKILCGEAQKSPQLDGKLDFFEISIAENCPQPAAFVVLTDSAGNILAQRNFFIGKNSQVELEKALQLQVQTSAKSGKSSVPIILIILLVLLIVLLAIYALWKFKKRSFIILLLLGAGLMISSGVARPAKAVTMSGAEYGYQLYGTGNLDKYYYHPMESVVATGTATYASCSNAPPVPAFLDVVINDSSYCVVNPMGCPGPAVGTAQNTPGDYAAKFTLSYPLFETSSLSIDGYEPYTVVSPPAINGECGSVNNTSSCTIPSGSGLCLTGAPSTVTYDVTSGKWIWTCAGIKGGTDAACSETKSVISAECGLVKDTCDPGTVMNPIETDAGWSWTCDNHCNGDTPKCFVAKTPIDGQCKSPPNGQTYCSPYSDFPNKTKPENFCNQWDPSDPPNVISDKSGWNWTCTGQNGSTVSPSCHASKGTPVVPKCGLPNFCTGSDTTLCAAGTPDPTTPPADTGYEFDWTCNGSCTAPLSIPCTAKGAKACGWIETNP